MHRFIQRWSQHNIMIKQGSGLAIRQNIILNVRECWIDRDEVSALVLLVFDAFSQADYVTAIGIWQRLWDLNSLRLNRVEVIEAINMAR